MTDELVSPLKTMRLRYAGRCRHCRVQIAAGTTAIYDTRSKTVVCVACLPLENAPLESAPLEPSPSGTAPVNIVEANIDAANIDAATIDAATIAAATIDPGTAGASAQREFDRRKNKRETRIREAHPHLGGLILALSDEPQSTKAWSTGARGEELLGRRLDGLAGTDVRVLHDRRIPPTRANIDHIVISPSGVFVIDAKKYQGRPTLKVEGGIIRPRVETLMVGARNCTKLVAGVQKQVAVVESALAAAGLRLVPVRGMMCFVEADWPLIGGDFAIDGISVLWPRKAASVITMPGGIDTETRERAAQALALSFPPA
jgi:hypothetical protein